jgi:hypothetical protein
MTYFLTSSSVSSPESESLTYLTSEKDGGNIHEINNNNNLLSFKHISTQRVT